MAYLLGTNIVIPFHAGDATTARLVRALLPSGVAISTVTSMEAMQGVIESADPIAARTEFETFLADVPIRPFSLDVVRRCAAFRRALKAQGRRVRTRVLDLIIAATALEHGPTLVARNLADYHDIPGLTFY